MKLYSKFGVYCFCTGVFFANCSPENNGGSSNNKRNIEKILATVQSNNEISKPVQQELIKQIQKQKEYNVTFEPLSSGLESKIKNAQDKGQIVEAIRSANLKNKINKSIYDIFNKIIDPVFEFARKIFFHINENYDESQRQLLAQYLGFDYKELKKRVDYFGENQKIDFVALSKNYEVFSSFYKEYFKKSGLQDDLIKKIIDCMYYCNFKGLMKLGYEETNKFFNEKLNNEKDLEKIIEDEMSNIRKQFDSKILSSQLGNLLKKVQDNTSNIKSFLQNHNNFNKSNLLEFIKTFLKPEQKS